jgi:hypothetical protein
MIYLNKWNQREVYSEILMVYFHITCQILDYPLKLMKILFKDSGITYDTLWPKLIQCAIPCLLISSFFSSLWGFHYLLDYHCKWLSCEFMHCRHWATSTVWLHQPPHNCGCHCHHADQRRTTTRYAPSYTNLASVPISSLKWARCCCLVFLLFQFQKSEQKM